MHLSGLFGCILIFRNEESATWAGGETTEAGDPEGQGLEFAAATLYLGAHALPSPCPPVPAHLCLQLSGAIREGGGGGRRGQCVHHFSSWITNWCRLIRTGRKPLLGFKEIISPKYNEQTVPIPPEILGKGRHPSAVVGKKAIPMDVMTSHEPTHLSWSDSALDLTDWR